MTPLLAEIVWNTQTLTIALGCSIPIIAIVASAWTSIEKTKSNNALKRDMIRQGMSVEEIERIISAKPSKRSQDE